MVKKRPRTPRTQARRAIRVGTARARSELIVMVSDAAGPATARRGPAVRRAAAVERIVQRAGIQLQPLFGVS